MQSPENNVQPLGNVTVNAKACYQGTRMERVSFKVIRRRITPFGHAPTIPRVNPDGPLRKEFQVEVGDLLPQIEIAPGGVGNRRHKVRNRAVIVKPPDIAIETIEASFFGAQVKGLRRIPAS